jgi:hypothetical protein
VEIPHSDLSKVTRMVLVHVRSVVMLSTSKTSSTRMLPVLAYSSMTGRDVSATAQLFRQHYSRHMPSQSTGFHFNPMFCTWWGNFSDGFLIDPEPRVRRPIPLQTHKLRYREEEKGTYCLRVLLKWVGILTSCCGMPLLS